MNYLHPKSNNFALIEVCYPFAVIKIVNTANYYKILVEL